MFNMWKRTYVHTLGQRSIYDAQVIVAESGMWNTLIPDTMFKEGGKLVYQEPSIDALVNEKFSGQYSNLMVELAADSEQKWSIVVQHDDYYKLLAHYLVELQFTYKISDDDLRLLAFTYMYNNFYYSGDQQFVSGFVGQTFQRTMNNVFLTYKPVGALAAMKPADLPTEIGYFLVKRGIVKEDLLEPKFVNAAKMVVSRLRQVHLNDFSEWLILDTRYFLNALKDPNTPEITADEFSFTDMFNLIASDDYLNSMFFTSFPFYSSNSSWDADPNFKVTAARLVNAWESLADYLVERGLDDDWAQLRHSDYAELVIRHEYVKKTCKAVRYILKLPNAVEALDEPIIDMLGYDLLSECFDTKYNKTLLLVSLRGMSPAYEGFVKAAFGGLSEPF